MKWTTSLPRRLVGADSPPFPNELYPIYSSTHYATFKVASKVQVIAVSTTYTLYVKFYCNIRADN